jgi:hypothetical protein
MVPGLFIFVKGDLTRPVQSGSGNRWRGEGTEHFERLFAFDTFVSPPLSSIPLSRLFLYMTRK